MLLHILLHWLVLGMRPLTFQELMAAVTFDPNTIKFDAKLALLELDDVLEICLSLVIRGKNKTVSLAHASVREYFLFKPRMLGNEELTICKDAAHALMTSSCLA